MLVCSSFLISVCMFMVSKNLLISSVTAIVCAGGAIVCTGGAIVCAGGAIWLNPFATVLFNVCSAVTVEQCFPTGAPRSPCAPWCIVKGSARDDITNK